MTKIKVLHIITRLDPGGSAINTLETVHRLDPEGFAVDLVAGLTNDPTGQTAAFLARTGIRCVFVHELVRDIHPLADVRAFFRLQAFIKRGRYDIVHTHTSKAGILGRWAARSAGVKRIVHTPHGHVFYGYFSSLFTGLFIMAERLTDLITDRFIELTDRGVIEHLALGIGNRAKWSVIPSGINLALFAPSQDTRVRVRRAYGIADDEVLVMSLGRLEKIKGNRVLVEAFAAVTGNSRVRLMLVGDGQERKSLEAMVREKGLGERVILVGFQEDAPAFLNAADFVVMASLNEGMGRTAVEAMACGKPVIASRVGGLPDVVRDGLEGVLVPPGDVAALASALTQLVNAPELRRTLAAKALQRVGSEFSVQTMVGRIADLYVSLMKQDRKTGAVRVVPG